MDDLGYLYSVVSWRNWVKYQAWCYSRTGPAKKKRKKSKAKTKAKAATAAPTPDNPIFVEDEDKEASSESFDTIFEAVPIQQKMLGIKAGSPRQLFRAQSLMYPLLPIRRERGSQRKRRKFTPRTTQEPDVPFVNINLRVLIQRYFSLKVSFKNLTVSQQKQFGAVCGERNIKSVLLPNN